MTYSQPAEASDVDLSVEGDNCTVSLLSRVAALPVVVSAFSTAQGLYEGAKSYHPTIQSTFETVEAGVSKVADKTLPYVAQKLEPIDRLGNEILDKVEERFPIVLESPSAIVEGGKQKVANAYAATGVQSAIDSGTTRLLTTVDAVVDRLLPAHVRSYAEMVSADPAVLAQEEVLSHKPADVSTITAKVQQRLLLLAQTQFAHARSTFPSTVNGAVSLLHTTKDQLDLAASTAQSQLARASTAVHQAIDASQTTVASVAETLKNRQEVIAAMKAVGEAAQKARGVSAAISEKLPAHMSQRLQVLGFALQESLTDLYVALSAELHGSDGTWAERTRIRLDSVVGACVASASRMVEAVSVAVRDAAEEEKSVELEQFPAEPVANEAVVESAPVVVSKPHGFGVEVVSAPFEADEEMD